jgi:UDP-N-acetylglucosamine 2-epimerase (non-hydrolysing)
VKITAVVGARPNFVKIAPILGEASGYRGLTMRLVHTGQHYDVAMSQAFFAHLEIPAPDVNLGVGAETEVGQLAEIMRRLMPVLADERPDAVLVVGDVTSTLAAALTAVKLGIPVAHVEAGLRSFDRTMPEEINRILTDAVARWLFTTEPAANENLTREGVGPERVHFVGNVMIDTLYRYRDQAQRSPILERLGVAPGGYAALTLHRPSNVDTPRALARILDAIRRVQAEIPVVFPMHPRTRRRLADLEHAEWAGMHVTDPLPYLDFVQLMANARCVLTDSGGIQEETTALGVPCLTLRTNTERPVTVTKGTNRVVGVEPAEIYAAWTQVRDGRWPAGEVPELWDGKAAGRIVRVLLETRG